MRRIYITHCSAKKDNSLCGTIKTITPDKLYTATPLQRFIKRCKDKKVEWAIFSDKFGVIFPQEELKWYDKHPNEVDEDELQLLLENFIQQLSNYDEIWFYHNPGRFHPLYKRLVKEAKERGLKVVLFTHLSEIR